MYSLTLHFSPGFCFGMLPCRHVSLPPPQDCLGHVALLTCFFARLAQLRPTLNVTIHAVFIASEEAEAKVGCCRDSYW